LAFTAGGLRSVDASGTRSPAIAEGRKVPIKLAAKLGTFGLLSEAPSDQWLR
jgi:hypothetical protein